MEHLRAAKINSKEDDLIAAAGVKDILSKSLGSANSLNIILATLEGMRLLRSPEEVAEIRGRPVSEVRPPWSEGQ